MWSHCARTHTHTHTHAHTHTHTRTHTLSVCLVGYILAGSSRSCKVANVFKKTYIIQWPWNYYTGAGNIIRISSKSWFISLIPFKKWNLYNVYIHSTQTDIFQVFISFNFDDYKWQLMKTPNSVSQKIRILLKTNTKKGFLEILANWKVWTWKVWACTALNT